MNLISDKTLNDYTTFVKYQSNLELLAYKIQQQWLPYIKKYAYSSIWKDASLSVEDFISEVYLSLYTYCKYIHLDKIKEETFSFFIYVRYACYRTKLLLFRHTPVEEIISYDDYMTGLNTVDEETNVVDSIFIKSLLDKLSKKEQDIVKRRIGFEDNHSESLESIGNSYGGLSRERIRQIEKKACSKLRIYL